MIEIDDASFQSTIESGTTLVDFHATWCRPCLMIAPMLETLSAEAEFLPIKFVKFNIDENPITTESLGITKLPTMILFQDGKEVSRETGALPLPRLKAWLLPWA